MKHIKDQPPPWWWDLLKIFIVFYMLVCLFGCIHIAGTRVKVHEDVEGNHEAIEKEVFAALNFIRLEEKLDKRRWEQGLTIEVFQNNIGSCGENCYYLGLYWHEYNRVHIVWGLGTCENALFHELYHRVSYLQEHRDGMFGGDSAGQHHGIEFQEAMKGPHEKWRVARGCTDDAP